MRYTLAALSLLLAGPGWAAERALIKPPISVAPTIPNSALGWWTILALGPSTAPGISENVRMDFDRSVKSATAACGYDVFAASSEAFTAFREDKYAFQVYAIGGYRTKADAQRVLDKVRPCMPIAHLKSMSLQSE